MSFCQNKESYGIQEKTHICKINTMFIESMSLAGLEPTTALL